MATRRRPSHQPTPRTAGRSVAERPAGPRRLHMPATSPIVLPIVAVCSIAMSACMAFGHPVLWTGNAIPEVNDHPVQEPVPQPTPEEQPDPVDPDAPQQVIIGEYEAISQSSDPGRRENIRLAAEAIDGTVIEPGEEFSFNDIVGNTSAERGYQIAAIISNGDVAEGYGGGICQVSTALYIAAVKADLEITERHPHSVPSDYAPIGLDATIVYDHFDLRIKNNTAHALTIHMEALGQTVKASITGDPLPEGRSVDATSHIVSQYEREDDQGRLRQYYVTESFRVFYEYGQRTTRDLLSSDIYIIHEDSEVVLAEGSVEPSK